MSEVVTFSGAERLISVNAGVTEIDVERDVYSAWKRWLAADAENSKWPQAMRTVGGDPLSETKDLGATFFLMNGWRIRPQEANHWLTVNGNLYTDPAGDSPFVSTLGNYTVTISMVVSNLSDASLAQMPQFEYSSFAGGVSIDTNSVGVGTDYPMGTPGSPVNNMDDALAIAQSRGIRRFFIKGDLLISNGDFSEGFIFEGESPMTCNVVINGTSDVTNCEFKYMPISGYLDAGNIVRECLVLDIFYENSFVYQSGLIGTLYIAPGAELQIWDSWQGNYGVDDVNVPVLDFSDGATVALRGYSGSVKIQNTTRELDILVVEMAHGVLIVDGSCVAGTIYIHHADRIVNNSLGTNVICDSPLQQVRKILTNKQVESSDGTTVTVYDDDNVNVLGEWTWTEGTKTRGKFS
jgi:hypothetical protein